MFGVMGIGAGFINAAGRGGKKKKNELRFTGNAADPTLYQVSCDGEINVISTKNGQTITQTYDDLSSTALSISADENSEIVIIGDLTELVFATNKLPGGYNNLVSVNTELCQSLRKINISDNNNIETIDVSKNIELAHFLAAYSLGLKVVNLSKNTKLTQCVLSNSTAITSIYYPATNQSVSNAIKNAIAAATAADGTVYTDGDGAYYSTIADAATAKGWTIEQL